MHHLLLVLKQEMRVCHNLTASPPLPQERETYMKSRCRKILPALEKSPEKEKVFSLTGLPNLTSLSQSNVRMLAGPANDGLCL